ncbi:hypothetical protein [Actinomycetospora termitidis]|uniref:ABC transporter permease n=1 Tax=Actinomycetospora termitidis TaxID=3053470 RepID=A0ABT7M8Z1_9PSEU|nr:hypothetical protein [Actinomycetospora sp. Odt1-22]MDL5156659.1 hypothetical protein [Actinomycetospora sp. Odt1-22]
MSTTERTSERTSTPTWFGVALTPSTIRGLVALAVVLVIYLVGAMWPGA